MPRNEKAPLEMTAEDHRAIGSTPPPELTNNPGKNLADLMDDTRLASKVKEEVEVVTMFYDHATKGDERAAEMLNTTLNHFLAPNVEYLREIGRLPEEYKDLDPETQFALTK